MIDNIFDWLLWVMCSNTVADFSAMYDSIKISSHRRQRTVRLDSTSAGHRRRQPRRSVSIKRSLVGDLLALHKSYMETIQIFLSKVTNFLCINKISFLCYWHLLRCRNLRTPKQGCKYDIR